MKNALTIAVVGGLAVWILQKWFAAGGGFHNRPSGATGSWKGTN